MQSVPIVTEETGDFGFGYVFVKQLFNFIGILEFINIVIQNLINS